MLISPAIADAPANHRIRTVLTSYAVPNASPRYSWASQASARPFASPPSASSPAGMRTVLTTLLPSR
ncbi:MAG TPA: hypothetical protein VFH03_07395 [Actinoplanes sp.]|nr:hypothetical protein [Actinoplanes sp.]